MAWGMSSSISTVEPHGRRNNWNTVDSTSSAVEADGGILASIAVRLEYLDPCARLVSKNLSSRVRWYRMRQRRCYALRMPKSASKRSKIASRMSQ